MAIVLPANAIEIPAQALVDDQPCIDWAQVVVGADNFFNHFYWPQKVGLVFVSNFQVCHKKELTKILSSVCSNGKISVKIKEGARGTCAYAMYEDQFEGQLAVLLLNGITLRGNELKILPCLNLYTEKLPEAIFKPVLNLHAVPSINPRDLDKIVSVFKMLWQLYSLNVRKREPTVNVGIVTSATDCKEIMRQIRSHRARRVALDCEGVSTANGIQLSLVQVSTPQEVFLFDVQTSGNLLFEEGGLKALLEDNSIMKITHDCRKDSAALFRQFGVKLANVFDTQVAYAVLCGQSSGPVPLPVSLGTLLSKFSDGASLKLKEEVKQEMSRDNEYWSQRPLTSQMISYARQDVYSLFIVYRNMKSLLSSVSRSIISARSSVHYAQQHKQAIAEHTCCEEISLPLYNLADWDKALIMQMYGVVCKC